MDMPPYSQHAIDYATFHMYHPYGMVAWAKARNKNLDFVLAPTAGEKTLDAVIYHLENFIALMHFLQVEGYELQGVVNPATGFTIVKKQIKESEETQMTEDAVPYKTSLDPVAQVVVRTQGVGWVVFKEDVGRGRPRAYLETRIKLDDRIHSVFASIEGLLKKYVGHHIVLTLSDDPNESSIMNSEDTFFTVQQPEGKDPCIPLIDQGLLRDLGFERCADDDTNWGFEVWYHHAGFWVNFDDPASEKTYANTINAYRTSRQEFFSLFMRQLERRFTSGARIQYTPIFPPEEKETTP